MVCFRAAYGIYTKSQRDETIETEILTIISAIFSSWASYLNASWTAEMSIKVRDGKTWAEVAASKSIPHL